MLTCMLLHRLSKQTALVYFIILCFNCMNCKCVGSNSQVAGKVDIVLSHDWPNGIHAHGNTEQLLRKKPFFR